MEERDGVPESEQIRRALREWLTKRDVMKSGRKQTSPPQASLTRQPA